MEKTKDNDGYINLCLPMFCFWVLCGLLSGKFLLMLEIGCWNIVILIFMRLIDGDGKNHID